MQILKTLGIIAIIFGIAVGICLIVVFSEPVSMGFFESEAELTFGEVVIAIGVSLLFVVLGALCIGIAKVLFLLESDHDDAIKVNPEDELGDQAGAISDYDNAIRPNRKDADMYYNRGLAKAAIGQHEAALADFQKARALDPDIEDE